MWRQSMLIVALLCAASALHRPTERELHLSGTVRFQSIASSEAEEQLSKSPDIEMWYINAKGQKDRDACINGQLREQKLQPNRWDATLLHNCGQKNGNKTSFKNCMSKQRAGDCVKGDVDWEALSTHGTSLSADYVRRFKVVSNWCSHKRLMTYLAEKPGNASYYVMFEDDVIINKQWFKPMIADFILNYKGPYYKTWDLVQIDPFGRTCDNQIIGQFRGKNVWKPMNLNSEKGTCAQYWGFQAILLRASALKKIVNNMETYKTVPVDWLQGQLNHALAWDAGIAENPEELMMPGELPAPWKEAKDVSTGLNYYYNAITKVTTWNRPQTKVMDLPEFCNQKIMASTIGFREKKEDFAVDSEQKSTASSLLSSMRTA